MDKNFDGWLKQTLKHEGGFVNNPKDPGGATNKGVTIATFRRFVKKDGTIADLKRITPEQVATVYRRNYWDVVRGSELPSGVDTCVADYAVNSGPSRAVKHLQEVLQVKVDGVIGPETMKAVTFLPPADVINHLCDRRLDFLHGLPTWDTFGGGWNTRVKGVRAYALGLAAAAPVAPAPDTDLAPPPPQPPPPPAVSPTRRSWVWPVVIFVVIAAGVAALMVFGRAS